jgi:tripartite-type tricarboxylate transporter receptor subunit TctC
LNRTSPLSDRLGRLRPALLPGLLLGLACGIGTQAWAQAPAAYPAKPITFIVPFGPGSGTDQQARMLGQLFSSQFKVPVIVDNKVGASGFLASQFVARAQPDGYTALVTTNTTHAANEHLFKKLPYEPVKDFAPVALLSKGYMLLLVRPNSPVRSVADLIALARKAPGKLSFGSGSSSSRVAGELLKQMAGLDCLNVPYKSNPQAITDLLGGQIDFMFADTNTALPQVAGEKLRAVAATSARKLAVLPGVPPVADAVPGYEVSFWTAVYLPAGAPPAVVKRLNEMVLQAAATPEMASFQSQSGGEITTTSPEGLAAFQAAESLKWGRVIRAAGIEAE